MLSHKLRMYDPPKSIRSYAAAPRGVAAYDLSTASEPVAALKPSSLVTRLWRWAHRRWTRCRRGLWCAIALILHAPLSRRPRTLASLLGNRTIAILVGIRTRTGVGADWYFTFLKDLITTWAVRLHVLGGRFHGFTAIAIERDGATILCTLNVARRTATCECDAYQTGDKTKFPEFLHT